MSFKTLHSFTISLDREITETSTRVENGQTITISSKIVKPVPHTVILKEPSRREKSDIALFQSVIYNDAISKGLLPKAVMHKKVGLDASSALTEDQDKNVATLNVRLGEISNEMARLGPNRDDDTEELKSRKRTLQMEYISLYKNVDDLNTAYQSVYAHTAENYRDTKTLAWLMLFLTYTKTAPDAKPEPLFAGGDFAAKEERAADMEDVNDPLYKAALSKLSVYWMLYLFGQANKTEDFAAYDERVAKTEEVERKIKEEMEKEKAAVSNDVPAVLNTDSVTRPDKVAALADKGTETPKALNESVVV